MAQPGKHTYESLKGVFVPCPLPSASSSSLHGRVVVGEKNMNPSMSVAATRRMADKSILSASNRLGGNSGHVGEDDVQDPTYRQPSSASASSSDEDESDSEDDESDSEDESESSSSGSSASSSESEDSEDEESRRARKRRKKAQQQQQQQNPLGTANRCFLCDYCTSKEVRFVSTFISDNIANMEVSRLS